MTNETVRPAQQVFERNGIRIEYPAGYRSFENYVSQIRMNLRIAQGSKANAHLVPKIQAAIELAERALEIK